MSKKILASLDFRKSVACRLQNLAHILEGEYQSAIVERRADDLKNDLAVLYGESRNQEQDLADFLKSATWTVGFLTIEGRAGIIVGAKEKAARLNKEGTEPRVSWRDIARLPTIDREFLNRTAGQLRHLANVLSERKTSGEVEPIEVEPEQGEAEKSPSAAIEGVSLQDAAACICPDDLEEQTKKVQQWRNSRTNPPPTAIGKDSEKNNRNLYDVDDLIVYLISFEGLNVESDFNLRTNLNRAKRPIAQPQK